MEDVCESLIAGPYASAVRDTLTKATPFLRELQQRYPNINPVYLAYLLREQTLVAMRYPTPQHRRLRHRWTTLLEALDEFFTAAFDRPRLADFLLYMALAPQEGEEKKQLTDFWTADLWGGDLVGILRSLEKRFRLPPIEVVSSGRTGGRPTSWWSDVIAMAMKEHFVKETGSPQWKAISTLLSCAPPIQFSMQPDKIRQRLVRWQRPEKLGRIGQKVLGSTAPDITFAADQLKRAYCQWRRQIEGKGPGRPRRPSPDILRATQTQKGADLSRFFPEFLIVIPS